MKTEFEISEPHTAEGIWSLISDVITHDLSFPSLRSYLGEFNVRIFPYLSHQKMAVSQEL